MGVVTRTILLVSIIAAAYLVAASSAAAQNLNITRDRIQFSDGTQQSTAATTTSARTITVSPVIGDVNASGQARLDAIADIAAAADASMPFPYSIILEPGAYDIQGNSINLPRYVSLRGAGPDVTRIRGNPSTGSDPVIRTNGDGVISDMTIRHRGGGSITSGRAVIAAGPLMRFENVIFHVANSFSNGATLIALSTEGGTDIVLTDCQIDITASSTDAQEATGIRVGGSPSSLTADSLKINIDPGLMPLISVGIWAIESGDVDITNASIRVTPGSDGTAAVFGDSTSLIRIRNSVIEATGGNYALNGSSTPIRVLASQIIGALGAGLTLRNCVDGNFNPI